METLKHVISFFLKIAIAFLCFAFIWWFVSLLFPGLSFRTIIPTSKSAHATSSLLDILPSPRLFKGLLGNQKPPTEYTNVYVPGPAYDGYGLTGKSGGDYTYSDVAYITYTSTGTVVTGNSVYDLTTGTLKDDASKGPGTNSSSRELYIRNLSVYDHGPVYSGLSFVGEARAGMFNQDAFTVVLFDAAKKVIGVSQARSTGQWAVPGWMRFETKLNYQMPMPKGQPCILMFEESRLPNESMRMPVQVFVPVVCS